MDTETEALLERAGDPRLIPGIYNYCHRRCERCPFTERCLTYIDVRTYEASHPDASPFDQVHDSFQHTFALIEAWCEREGIDVENLRAEGNSESAAAELKRAGAADADHRADSLHRLAWAYSRGAFEIVRSLENAAPLHRWPSAVREAIDTIGWSSGIVSAKTHRALHGVRDRADDRVDRDDVQNDWNGSAKVARLAIAESLAAWDVLFDAGQAAADSPMRQMIVLLQRIDEGLAQRFPLAMEFVRPGFDEPDVAAGALTTRAPHEPRHKNASRAAL